MTVGAAGSGSGLAVRRGSNLKHSSPALAPRRPLPWTGMRCTRARLLLAACLVDGVRALHLAARCPSRCVVRMVDPAILREVAVYDSTMEAKLLELEARVASADWNAAQNRELVGKAQADLAKQEQMRVELKEQVTALEEAKADVEKQLQTKTEEVAKFAASVESEITAARKSVKELTIERNALKAELEERTTEVSTLNSHLEAHTGTTLRLNKEVAELKAALAAAKGE